MGNNPHIVTSLEQLHVLVEQVQSTGAFAFDVETRGILERHPDMVDKIGRAHV